MPPVIVFAAYSGTGKTTYLEKLIRCLKSAGLRVAVIKHDAHEFRLDQEGKDSKRFADAGADCVALSSASRFAYFEQNALSLEEIAGRLDADIILTEGYKSSGYPRVAVFRAVSGKGLAADPAECLAVVSDVPMDAACPAFPLDDARPLAEFLIRRFHLPIGGTQEEADVHLQG